MAARLSGRAGSVAAGWQRGAPAPASRPCGQHLLLPREPPLPPHSPANTCHALALTTTTPPHSRSYSRHTTTLTLTPPPHPHHHPRRPQDITWHEADWSNPESRFLAFTLHDRGQGCGDVYAAFNAHHFQVRGRRRRSAVLWPALAFPAKQRTLGRPPAAHQPPSAPAPAHHQPITSPITRPRRSTPSCRRRLRATSGAAWWTPTCPARATSPPAATRAWTAATGSRATAASCWWPGRWTGRGGGGGEVSLCGGIDCRAAGPVGWGGLPGCVLGAGAVGCWCVAASAACALAVEPRCWLAWMGWREGGKFSLGRRARFGSGGAGTAVNVRSSSRGVPLKRCGRGRW